jgi:uncharacterized protein
MIRLASSSTRVALARRPASERISLDEARRIALAAQGFSDGRPSARVDVRHIRRVIDRVSVLQIDSVNVLCRSHYLPLFARLGPYPRVVLDRLSWGMPGRELFEFWAHAASLLPLRMYPLLRWRMQAAAHHRWGSDLDPDGTMPWAVVEGMTRLAKQQPGLVDEVVAAVSENGPMTAAEVSPGGRRRGPTSEGGQLWNWHDAKIALEWLFCTGRVAIAARRPSFERVYDLTERVIPPTVLAASIPSKEDAQRQLIRIAAGALGVATARDLCGRPSGYLQLPQKQSNVRIAELVEAQELIPVAVDGLREQMYLSPQARTPREVRARALLSPFDSLIWNRDRTLRLFDFHYRIGIYTPVAKRTHGYYVLPFLLDDRLTARVDLKADRQESSLLVQAAYAERDVRETEVAAELAAELRLMASWLELARVVVSDRGDLAPALARAVSAGG